MRFQMESAKIPYMKRTFDDGILEAWRIYKTQYKAKWAPVSGRELCYVVRYYKTALNEYVIFLDSKFRQIGREYSVSEIASINAILPQLVSFEWKTGSLISILYGLGKNKLTFYNPSTGNFDEYKYTITSSTLSTLCHLKGKSTIAVGYGEDLDQLVYKILFSFEDNTYLTSLGIHVTAISETEFSIYLSYGTKLIELSIALQEDGGYVFTPTVRTVSLATRGIRYDNGSFFYRPSQISHVEQYYASGILAYYTDYVLGLRVLDPATGDVVEEKANPILCIESIKTITYADYWVTPSLRYSWNIGKTTGGSFYEYPADPGRCTVRYPYGDKLMPYVSIDLSPDIYWRAYSRLCDVLLTVGGDTFYVDMPSGEFAGWPSSQDFYIYDVNGNLVYSSLAGVSSTLSVSNILQWVGFTMYSIKWLEFTFNSETTDCINFYDPKTGTAEVLTTLEFYAKFHIPEDIYSLSAINYLPTLENNSSLAGYIGFSK